MTSESWSSDNERLANSRSPNPSSPTTTTGPQRLALNPVTGRGCGRWTRPDVGHSFARGARMKVTPCCAVRVECAVCGVRGASPSPSGYDGGASQALLGTLNRHLPCEKSKVPNWRDAQSRRGLCAVQTRRHSGWTVLYQESSGLRESCPHQGSIRELRLRSLACGWGGFIRSGVRYLLRACSFGRSTSTCTCGRTSTFVQAFSAWQPHHAVRRGRLVGRPKCCI